MRLGCEIVNRVRAYRNTSGKSSVCEASECLVEVPRCGFRDKVEVVEEIQDREGENRTDSVICTGKHVVLEELFPIESAGAAAECYWHDVDAVGVHDVHLLYSHTCWAWLSAVAKLQDITSVVCRSPYKVRSGSSRPAADSVEGLSRMHPIRASSTVHLSAETLLTSVHRM